MIYVNTPSLGLIRGGTELRSEATKLMSAAEIAFDLGGSDGKAKLLEFWKFQKDAVKQDYGHPSDGPYLGIGYADIRRQCYKALSHIRCHRTPEYEKLWNDFCDYFISNSSVQEEPAPITSLRAITYFNGKDQTTPLPFSQASVGIRIWDQVSPSLSVPLLIMF